jgi:hypothetical protein
MPTIVEDIGGARYFAWVIIGFVLSATIGHRRRRSQPRTLRAPNLLSSGLRRVRDRCCGKCAYGSIEVLVLARVAQGLGGGLLAGPRICCHTHNHAAEALGARNGDHRVHVGRRGRCWAGSWRALWRVRAWRCAYGCVAAAAFVLIVATRALPEAGETREDGGRRPLPIASLTVLISAVLVISLGSLVSAPHLILGSMGAGLSLLVVFAMVELRMTTTLLPTATYERGNPLKWVYLTAAFMCAGVMIENFIPLFAQKLGGLAPLLAGVFGAVLSAGWVVAQMFIVTVEDPRSVAWSCVSALCCWHQGWGCMAICRRTTRPLPSLHSGSSRFSSGASASESHIPSSAWPR